MVPEKVVWVLGSGFSKPLGGPLLKDLFRRERKVDILPFFPEREYPDLAESLPWIQLTFHNGMQEGLWENAEQFMAYVDDEFRVKRRAQMTRLINLILRSDPSVEFYQAGFYRYEPSREIAGEILHQEYRQAMPEGFDKKVRRALASECLRFTMGADVKSERWAPHRAWVSTLEEGKDTVISFNYDLAVELASEASETGRIEVVKPRPDFRLEDLPRGRVPLLKLHGSVDWRMTIGSDSSKSLIGPNSVSREDILRSPNDEIAIAAPGGSKAQLVDSDLGPIWGLAEQALRQATIVMVVGYSFPDTDPMATDRLLRALESRDDGARRQIHIILGADVNTPSSQRVVSLMTSTSNGRPLMTVRQLIAGMYGTAGLAVKQHPLGTQDFIGRHTSFLSALTTEFD